MTMLGQLASLSVCGKNFNVVIFSDTVNMINVTLCMMEVFLELYLFTPLSVTLIASQGHSVSGSFNLKFYVFMLSYYVQTL